MTIDLHFVVTLLLTAVSGGIGWFCRELWGAVQLLRREMSALEIRIGTDYVRYDRLQDALRPVIQRLDTISETLAHKLDKPS